MNPDILYMSQLAFGFPLLKCIQTVCKLDIAEHLKDGPKDIVYLASKTNTIQDLLARVLRCLAGNGIFKQNADGLYENTPRSTMLRDDVQGSLKLHFLIQLGDEHFNSINMLDTIVKTGEYACEKLYGSGVWDVYVQQLVERGAMFNKFMTSASALNIPSLVEGYDYTPYKKIVDVGGGYGHLVSAILKKASPEAKGIVYDLPYVIKQAKEKYEGDAKLEFVPGSFFEQVPSDGDLYLMKWILHDYNDDKAKLILRNTRKAMHDKSKLLIMDSMLSSGNDFHVGKHIDIVMMTVVSGKERTVEEFEKLANETGFQLTGAYLKDAMVSIIEFTPT